MRCLSPRGAAGDRGQRPVQRLTQVKTVWLEIGELSGRMLRRCAFASMRWSRARWRRAPGWRFVATEGQGRCLTCGQTVHIQLRYDPCPLCGGYPVEPTGGLEMKVKELEVE